MASYKAPETAVERLNDFNNLVEEFKKEYALVTEKQKKVSGYRARKALLSISKLTKLIRKDIQDYLISISGKEEKVEEKKEDVTAVAENTTNDEPKLDPIP